MNTNHTGESMRYGLFKFFKQKLTHCALVGFSFAHTCITIANYQFPPLGAFMVV